jgi:hypothetical protein
MSLPPLATAADVEARLGRSLAPQEQARIDALLTDVSAMVRNRSGQKFSRIQSVTRMRAIDGKLKLVQKPVISVDLVQIVNWDDTLTTYSPGVYWFDGIDTIGGVTLQSGVIVNSPAIWADQVMPAAFQVTYTHGDTETPADILAIVCNAILRALGASSPSGTVSETVGQYSYRLDSSAVGGVVGFLADEVITMRRYKKAARTVALR